MIAPRPICAPAICERVAPMHRMIASSRWRSSTLVVSPVSTMKAAIPKESADSSVNRNRLAWMFCSTPAVILPEGSASSSLGSVAWSCSAFS